MSGVCNTPKTEEGYAEEDDEEDGIICTDDESDNDTEMQNLKERIDEPQNYGLDENVRSKTKCFRPAGALVRPWSSEECFSTKQAIAPCPTVAPVARESPRHTVASSATGITIKENPFDEAFSNKELNTDSHNDIVKLRAVEPYTSSPEVNHTPSTSEYPSRLGNQGSPISQLPIFSPSTAIAHPFNSISSSLCHSINSAKSHSQSVRLSSLPTCPRLPSFHQWSSQPYYPYSPLSDMFFRNSFPQAHQQLLFSAPRMLPSAGASANTMLEDSKDLVLTSSIESLRLRARHHAACLGLLHNSPRT
ncbi:hypothetical protein ElyMa_006487700 [Elysia marginata]|uniref:OAR domain-containing protein n=1 Tax=Elysia marginata TaxID=1093978 RepID=A0AAV4I3K2_9GAST|nr:hypothetical protein ElyMa_006487700 [Elysia marginata]